MIIYNKIITRRGCSVVDNEKAPAGQVHKTLSNFDYFNVGFGAIVGIGWILMVGDWVVLGGGPLADCLFPGRDSPSSYCGLLW